jgi:hypothetical protein
MEAEFDKWFKVYHGNSGDDSKDFQIAMAIFFQAYNIGYDKGWEEAREGYQ